MKIFKQKKVQLIRPTRPKKKPVAFGSGQRQTNRFFFETFVLQTKKKVHIPRPNSMNKDGFILAQLEFLIRYLYCYFSVFLFYVFCFGFRQWTRLRKQFLFYFYWQNVDVNSGIEYTAHAVLPSVPSCFDSSGSELFFIFGELNNRRDTLIFFFVTVFYNFIY